VVLEPDQRVAERRVGQRLDAVREGLRDRGGEGLDEAPIVH
jgi:hypothetical protein